MLNLNGQVFIYATDKNGRVTFKNKKENAITYAARNALADMLSGILSGTPTGITHMTFTDTNFVDPVNERSNTGDAPTFFANSLKFNDGIIPNATASIPLYISPYTVNGYDILTTRSVPTYSSTVGYLDSSTATVKFEVYLPDGVIAGTPSIKQVLLWSGDPLSTGRLFSAATLTNPVLIEPGSNYTITYNYIIS